MSNSRLAAFTLSPDVARILAALLDIYERRQTSPTASEQAQRAGVRRIRVTCDALALPAYHSQTDPAPRQIANEQLRTLERLGYVALAWQPGEAQHLLAAVTLQPAHAGEVFALLNRIPQAMRRARLSELLRADRFRSGGWRLRALQHTLAQLREEKSPAPFSLSDEAFNQDLLLALAALDGVSEETPYRVFSVRLFNDSKRLEEMLGALATLARRHEPTWKEMTNDEVLRELNLVANPTYLSLHGAWRLAAADGSIVSLADFQPSVGLASAQAMRMVRVTVDAPQVVCIENPTSFYEWIRVSREQNCRPHTGSEPRRGLPGPNAVGIAPHAPLAALCLNGNPSPACRHVLARLSPDVPLLVWADVDYGGLNILAQLREQVNPNAQPHGMDIETFEAHVAYARPLSATDGGNLERLLRRPSLADMRPLIAHLLQRGLKLEQEAIRLRA